MQGGFANNLAKARSYWLINLAARELVPFKLSRIKPRSHVVVYLVKNKIQFQNQKTFCAEDYDESAALFSETKQWEKRFYESPVVNLATCIRR